ncbi:MAG: Sua5/YciO/YrdC/YwlC family protein, partial [Gemmatimonadota bacterium]|nr:Sua5/YciO/YrdC/YwlC family protein [Gemmatimonadota bacterium]
IGLLLAYPPLHMLLFDALGAGPVVMTSGNASYAPIAMANDEARLRLDGIADAFLLHDREIVARYDDSVVRVVDDRPVFLRRSRGYAPMPLALPVPVAEGILAVGPHLKNTFTLAQGTEAFVSQHIGDLENLETLEHFHAAVARFRTLFRIEPTHVVRDLHPGYLSTTIAESAGLPELEPVQHHHAHIAAVMGEHQSDGRALGLAFDGTGYGTDGHVWGFEFLEADLERFRRLAHLRYAPLPGGDRAVRSPWRTLIGYGSLDPAVDDALSCRLSAVHPIDLAMARAQARRGINAPLASSMGRLFDAAAALLGVRLESSYEGQAAMELEAIAGEAPADPLPFPSIEEEGGVEVLDPLPLLTALAAELDRGAAIERLAARFHDSLVHAVCGLSVRLCERRGLTRVALGGGCFQNGRLLRGVLRRLEDAGLEVLLPMKLGPNDGAVSYGQAVVAAARSNR